MTETSDSERETLLRRRRANLESRTTSPAMRILGGAGFALLFGLVALLILAPKEVSRLFTDGASHAENMQKPADPSIGLTTEMTIPPVDEPDAVETEATDIPVSPPEGDSNAERERIAALEREIDALRAANGENTEQIRNLLDEQAKTLQEQFERERELAEERHQRELQDALATRPVTAGIGGEDPSDEARRQLEEERVRLAEIRAAQIASDGIVLDAAGRISDGEVQGGGGERRFTDKERFMASASTGGHEAVRATSIAAPDRTLAQGTMLRATLETAISTELPGPIRAVISDDVYSYDGTTVLLPRGTRLIGSYNSDISVVQGRAQLAWNRAVTPSGFSVELGGVGADTLGRSGQEGFIDGRFRERFGSAALISLLGTAPEIVVDDTMGRTSQEGAEDLGSDLETASQGVMADYLQAPPVIYVDQGTAISVFVNRDLVF